MSSCPGQPEPGKGLDRMTAAESCVLGPANLLPQDEGHHLERCFLIFYHLRTQCHSFCKICTDGTYLLFPSSHLEADTVA